MKKKKSFFEKITGTINPNNFDGDSFDETSESEGSDASNEIERRANIMDAEEEAQLTVDVYQTPDHIVIQAMVAGVDPGDLDVQISRDMVTIRGTRRDSKSLSEDDYFYKELYWGSFSRTILLPAEIEVEEAEAMEDHGLVTLKLSKVDKDKKTKLKIKVSK